MCASRLRGDNKRFSVQFQLGDVCFDRCLLISLTSFQLWRNEKLLVEDYCLGLVINIRDILGARLRKKLYLFNLCTLFLHLNPHRVTLAVNNYPRVRRQLKVLTNDQEALDVSYNVVVDIEAIVRHVLWSDKLTRTKASILQLLSLIYRYHLVFHAMDDQGAAGDFVHFR